MALDLDNREEMCISLKTGVTLVTGANGFIGRVLCAKLIDCGWFVRGTVRSENRSISLPDLEIKKVESIGPATNWLKTLEGVDSIVHLAARVHVMQETETDPIKAFRSINVDGTVKLASEAANAGVRRFIFLSTIGVNGDVTYDRAFTEEDDPDPHNAYSLSKYEAEQRLKSIGLKTGMEVVIIRSPLVYGPGNPGNFLELLRIMAKGFPLPLGGLCNQRSMIYVGNLADTIIACLEHSKAGGETFLVSDGVEISTPDLIRMIVLAMGKKPRLLSLPPVLINIFGKVTGKSEEVERLANSLCVDSGKIRRMLGWRPPFTMEKGIRETVRWFMKDRGYSS